MAQQPLVGQGLLVVKASRSHLDSPYSVGLLWTSDQPDAETSIWQNTHTHNRRTSTPFGKMWTHNPSKRASLDRAATGIGVSAPPHPTQFLVPKLRRVNN